DLGPPLLQEGERLGAASRRDDVVPVPLQAGRHEQEDVLVVLGDEHRRHATSSFSGSGLVCDEWDGSSRRKMLPPPSRLLATSVPPCRSAIARAMKRPRPVPGT